MKNEEKAQMLRKQMKYLYGASGVFDVVAIDPEIKDSELWGGETAKGPIVGRFDDCGKAIKAILSLDRVRPAGIYLSLNKCDENAEADNRLHANRGRTKGAEVPRLKNVLFDFDADRPSKTSTTDEQHEAALAVARKVKKGLKNEGWPSPLNGDSGNGAHLIYNISLANTLENRELIKSAASALAQQYNTDVVKMDMKVFLPSQLVKAYGTFVRKGESTEDRPHRLAKILYVPEKRKIVTEEQLRAVAAKFVPGREPVANGLKPVADSPRKLDVIKYLDHYHVTQMDTKKHGNATLYCLEECLFDPTHKPNESAIGQTEDGMLFYQCFHNSCLGKHWSEARRKISGDQPLEEFYIGIPEIKIEPPQIITASSIVEAEVDEEPLIEGLINRKESCLLYGSSGIGKSALSLNLALAATKTDLLWGRFKVTRPLTTLFVQSENSLASTKKRLKLITHVRPDLEKALDHLYFPLLGNDCTFEGDLLDRYFQDQLRVLIFKTGADLLILDPLVSYHNKNENDNAEMRKALDALKNICRDTEASTLVIHHAGKGGNEGGARGASAITDWAANIISLKQEESSSGSQILKVSCQKSRNFKRFEEIHLKCKDGLFFERCKVEPTDTGVVVTTLESLGGEVGKQSELVKKMKEADSSLSDAKAQRLIQKAKDSKRIEEVKKGNAKGLILIPQSAVEATEKDLSDE